MPKIKLIQKYGSYGFGALDFKAGKVYEVDYPTANCLVNQEKVAVEVNEVESPAEGQVKQEPPQEKTETEKFLSPSEGIIKIAVVRIGGIGDSLITAGLAVAIKRKYPNSHITLYIRDKDSREIVIDNPAVDHVVMVGNKVIENLVEGVILKKGYDIVYDVRYMTKVYYSEPERFAEDKKIMIGRAHV